MQPLDEFLEDIDDDDLEPSIRRSFEKVRSGLPPALRAALAAQDTSQGEDALGDAHSRSAYLGRRLAGNDSPFGDYDTEFGKLAAESEAQWLEGVFTDVANGRYTNDDGTIDTERLEARCANYENRLRGTANEAWANSLDSDELIDWLLGEEDSANCSVCPYLAEDGPYPANQLPTMPGANETPCMFNCRCKIATVSGQVGF